MRIGRRAGGGAGLGVGLFLRLETVVLTAGIRHPRPEAEGHCVVRPGPEPTEPLRRRYAQRCLQHMAPFQRTGSLRCAAFHRRLLHHAMGHRQVSHLKPRGMGTQLMLALQEPLPQLQGRT